MLLRKKEKIEEWLNRFHIRNYELIEDEEYGYVVNIKGNINLFNQKLKSIDIKFNKVSGWFDCSSNKLKSLMGCPEIIDGYFNCSNNQLNSLKFIPKKINYSVCCSRNKLTSLEYCPKIVKGDFVCSNNKLMSLEGCPEIVNRYFFCNHNKLNIKGVKNLLNVEVKSNYIELHNNNILLGELQNIKDFNEIKKILTINQEKQELKSLLTKNKTKIIKEKIIKI